MVEERKNFITQTQEVVGEVIFFGHKLKCRNITKKQAGRRAVQKSPAHRYRRWNRWPGVHKRAVKVAGELSLTPYIKSVGR